MSCFPDEIFRQALSHSEMSSVCTVDLSWSYLPKDWKGFLKYLSTSNITKIIFSGHEPDYHTILSYIKSQDMFSVYQRRDVSSSETLPTLPIFVTRNCSKLSVTGRVFERTVDRQEREQKEQQASLTKE